MDDDLFDDDDALDYVIYEEVTEPEDNKCSSGCLGSNLLLLLVPIGGSCICVLKFL